MLSTLSPLGQATTSEQQVLKALASGSLDERAIAVERIHRMPLNARPASVLPAFLAELLRVDRELDERLAAILAGKSVTPKEELGAYIGALIETVCQYDDPTIIRPLLKFVDTGEPVMHTIARFGDRAVEDVVALAKSQERPNASSALDILTVMLEESKIRDTLRPRSLDRIADAAKQRLSGKQSDVTVERAIELAVATGRKDLMQRVRTLATDQSAVRELGIVDEKFVAQIQMRASNALARQEPKQ